MSNQIQQEILRQSRESFNLAQKYYYLGLWSSAASSAIGLAAAISLLCGHGNIATLTALTNLLPTLTCHQVIKSGAKQLEDASDRLREFLK
ncbi:hypothetical protein [Alkalinema sp. FACHB-956]|uniref:hypothetical protein n=1 Tax=Alkalinema sp. FACHB-956 TaxID=2692768 RepID=UPI001685E6A4|nr:hypothetical protein [Alkalinema sp. FACHB-956]MBD2326722.1 hypothetical protein [Alkalinema sp. FACHB-956]